MERSGLKTFTRVVIVLFAGSASATGESVDVFNAIPTFRNLTAVYASATSEGDDLIECLNAQLTYYDTEAGKAIYVWYLIDKEMNQSTIINSIYKGDSPEYVQVVISTDPWNPFNATVPYTDYETCVILKQDGVGESCILWVNNEFKNDVPEACAQNYKESCGEGTVIYDKETCDA